MLRQFDKIIALLSRPQRVVFSKRNKNVAVLRNYAKIMAGDNCMNMIRPVSDLRKAGTVWLIQYKEESDGKNEDYS